MSTTAITTLPPAPEGEVITPTIKPPKAEGNRTDRDRLMQICAELFLTGQYNHQAIADIVTFRTGIKVHRHKVSQLIQEQRVRWRAQAAADTNTWFTREIAKLDNMEIEAHRCEVGADKVMCLLKIQERRAKLLGLDKPIKVAVEHSTKEIKDCTDEELNEIIRTGGRSPVGLVSDGQGTIEADDSEEMKL